MFYSPLLKGWKAKPDGVFTLLTESWGGGILIDRRKNDLPIDRSGVDIEKENVVKYKKGEE